MKSIDLATSSVSISARTSGVKGFTVRSGPPAVALTICGPFANSSAGGAGIEWVSSIVLTYVAESQEMSGGMP